VCPPRSSKPFNSSHTFYEMRKIIVIAALFFLIVGQAHALTKQKENGEAMKQTARTDDYTFKLSLVSKTIFL
jgi:hypothetical protein